MGVWQPLERLARRIFWLGGEPDPRAVQFGFVVLLHLSVIGSQSIRLMPDTPVLWALRCSGLVLVATLFLTPRVRNHGVLIRVLAHVDLAIIGLTALDLDVGSLPLVVLPAAWLARELRWRATWRVFVSTAFFVTLPGSLMHGNRDGTAVQLVTLPFVAVVAVLAIAVAVDAAATAQVEAEAQRNEAQRAFQLLKEQQRATDAIVETVDVGLVLLDREGGILLRNKRQEEIDLRKYPGGRGHSLPHQVYSQDAKTPLPMLALPSTAATRGDEFDDFRIWVGDEPKTRRALSVSARQVYDEDGERVGAALAFKDVTDLMRAMQVKDEFIALVSHELRTPLTSIHGYASILLDSDDLPERATRQIEVIARNSDRLETLVDDLLEAARVAGEKLHLDLRPTDLVDLIHDAVEAAEPMARKAGVEISVATPPSLALAVDKKRIAQVLDNLISNAIKYTQPGGWARVELSSRADQVELRVSDSGIGIRPDELSQLFCNFFRTQEASTRAIQGVGLGLAITRTIVESHGGRIEVASQPGIGSVFTVVLPVDHAEAGSLQAAS
jgi:signal transduction histidine kinase